MNERRLARRWRTILAGRIILADRSQPIACVVRDLSNTGARLYCADTSRLPAEFELEIPSRGLKVRSRLMWSQGANRGVNFLEEVIAWTDPLRAAA